MENALAYLNNNVISNSFHGNHCNIMDVHSSGYIAVLGENGKLVIVDGSSKVLMKLDFVINSSNIDYSKIRKIEFNSVGNKLLLSGASCMYVLEMNYNVRTRKYTKEPLDAQKFVLRNGKEPVVLASVPLEFATMDKASEYLKNRGMKFTTISQDVYMARAKRIGNYSEHVNVLYTLWHSISEKHVMVLSETDELELYDTDTGVVEQVFEVNKRDSAEHLVAFCFGNNVGWERFTVYTLGASGTVHMLCPIVPNGCSVQASDIEELKKYTMGKIHLSKGKALNDQNKALKAELFWLNELWKRDVPVQRKTTNRIMAPDDSDDDEDMNAIYAPSKAVALVANVDVNNIWPVQAQVLEIYPTVKKCTESNAFDILCLPSAGDMLRSSSIAISFECGILNLIQLHQIVRPVWKSAHAINLKNACGTLRDTIDLAFDKQFGSPMLVAHLSTPNAIFAYHATCLRMIYIPWLGSNRNSDDQVKATGRTLFAVSPTSQDERIVGARVFQHVLLGRSTIIRLASGSYHVVNISSSQLSEKRLPPAPPVSETIASFAMQIKTIAERRQQGIIKIVGKTKLNQADDRMIEFVLDNLKSLEESEVLYIHEVDQALKDRLVLHTDMIAAQKRKLSDLTSLIKQQETVYSTLAKRIGHILKIQENIQLRSAAVLQAVSENQPFISRAEIAYHDELKSMNSILSRLKPKVTGLVLQAKQQMDDAQVPRSPVDIAHTPSLSQERQKNCRDVMAANHELLAGATKKVQLMLKALQLG